MRRAIRANGKFSLSCLLVGFLFLSLAARADETEDYFKEALQSDLGRAPSDVDLSCADLKTKPFAWTYLILASKKVEARARETAENLSKQLKIAFFPKPLTEPRTGFTRCPGEGDCLTIEDSNLYPGFARNLFVVVAHVGTEAGPLLESYRDRVQGAYAKQSEVAGDKGGFGGASSCFETTWLVLAKTRTLEKAEDIARGISQLTGFPKVAESDPWFNKTCTDNPCVQIRPSNEIDDKSEYSHYYVVGAEKRDEPMKKVPGLDAYKKWVPKAYTLKRAFPVCGS